MERGRIQAIPIRYKYSKVKETTTKTNKNKSRTKIKQTNNYFKSSPCKCKLARVGLYCHTIDLYASSDDRIQCICACTTTTNRQTNRQNIRKQNKNTIR